VTPTPPEVYIIGLEVIISIKIIESCKTIGLSETGLCFLLLRPVSQNSTNITKSPNTSHQPAPPLTSPSGTPRPPATPATLALSPALVSIRAASSPRPSRAAPRLLRLTPLLRQLSSPARLASHISSLPAQHIPSLHQALCMSLRLPRQAHMCISRRQRRAARSRTCRLRHLPARLTAHC
jgi:hypothetical protein